MGSGLLRPFEPSLVLCHTKTLSALTASAMSVLSNVHGPSSE